MPRTLLVATRNPGKLGEIRQLLSDPALDVRGLDDVGIEETEAEDRLEEFATFEENALAKARYFAGLTQLWTLADDSGLCVDALDGAPGVHSKRFSGRSDLRGAALDAANNRALLQRLSAVPPSGRNARFICVIALADGGRPPITARGVCTGTILLEPRGSGGFGYDPLFFVPGENATLAELSPRRKNQLSHRAAALQAAKSVIRTSLDPSEALR